MALCVVSLFGRILVTVGVVVGFSTSALAAKVLFDYFDTENFVDEDRGGNVRFFIDVLDDNYRVVPQDGITEVKVFVDKKEVAGTWSLETVREADEPVAIAILIAAHQAYAYTEEGSGAPNVLRAAKQGYKGFLESFSDQDWVTVWYYNEEGIKKVISWGQNMTSASDQIAQVREGDKGQLPAPGLYNALTRVADDLGENAEVLPRRRLIVVLSDGKDKFLDRTSLLERKIDGIVDTAETAGKAKVYALGYTMDLRDPLVHLNTLAQKTNGVYRLLDDVESEEALVDELRKLSQEIKNQYVLTFKPEEYSGSEAPVSVRLELKTSAGPGTRIIDNAAWPEKPFDWMRIVIIALIVIGSLLGLFILIKIFKGIAARRSNRPVEYEEEEEFVGAYKGKLTCTGGAYAGQEFFLTEDVTTIGSIAGNGIVIQEAGVSKRHAGVKIEDMRFELADFGSTNGTYVNGNKITKQFLRDSDHIRIGECELRFTLK